MFKEPGSRRGVRMIAASRKRQWRDEEEDVDASDDSGDERKASQLEWEAIAREVRTEKLRHQVLQSGSREAVVDYDDVAGEHVEAARVPLATPESPRSEELVEERVRAENDDEEDEAKEERTDVSPQEDSKASNDEPKQKKRGGKKESGAAKRRQKQEAEGEDGEAGPSKRDKKKKKGDEDKDPDRWLKLVLEGEAKPKRIDTTRLVHYHDFDSFSAAQVVEEAPEMRPGNFRSGVSANMFDDDDDA